MLIHRCCQNAWHFVFQLLEPPVTSLVAATVALEMPRASGALVASGGALVLQQLIAGCQDWTQVLVATEALDEHLGELLRMGFHRMVATPAILRLQELGWKAEMEKVLDEVLETRFSAGKKKCWDCLWPDASGKYERWSKTHVSRVLWQMSSACRLMVGLDRLHLRI